MRLWSIIRNRSKWLFSYSKDLCVQLMYGNPEIKSIDETIQKIIDEDCSVARYGDGELEIMCGRRIDFQNYDENLAQKMKKVLQYDASNMLVCLPDSFHDDRNVKLSVRKYWKQHMRAHRQEWISLLKPGKTYYNAYISRFYLQFVDKKNCAYYVELLKKIWDKRDLLIVEGEKSRLGVGNDLFSNAKSIQRVLCPAKEAFSVYDSIIEEICKIDKDHLILIALGPTATAMAFDLHKLGYQAIDIGHIDIEYEWMRMGAESKVAVKGKYTNEAKDQDGTAVCDCDDIKYNREIIAVIK